MTHTLSETDRYRAAGFIRAFVAELKSTTGNLQAELTDDSYPELRIIKPVQGRPLTPSDIIASAAVLGAVENDFSVWGTGLMVGVCFLSDAVERARDILQGVITV